MHKKYAKDGLVCVSVSLDDTHDKKLYPKVKKKIDAFLKEQKATFPNYIVSDKTADTYKRLGVNAVPLVYVFNRDNRFVLKLPVLDKDGDVVEEPDYDKVEKTVQKLLKEKGKGTP